MKKRTPLRPPTPKFLGGDVTVYPPQNGFPERYSRTLNERLLRPSGWVSGVLCNCGRSKFPSPEPPRVVWETAWVIRLECSPAEVQEHGGHKTIGALAGRDYAVRVAESLEIWLEAEEWHYGDEEAEACETL